MSGRISLFSAPCPLGLQRSLCSVCIGMPRNLAPARRCEALNKAGNPCGITSTSLARTGAGELAAEPLLQGGARCLYHARWFVTKPARDAQCGQPLLLVYIDLETTGLSLRSAEIVEIGALAAHSGAAFSTVVRPQVLPADTGVHGIAPAEMVDAPSFPVVFARLVAFFLDLAANALSDDESSDDEAASGPLRLCGEVPCVLLAAHNGMVFDFPMLLSSCWRRDVLLGSVDDWLFVDTLAMLRAVDKSGACLKLQCQRVGRGVRVDACAHRALDDCVALAAVVDAVAIGLGTTACALLLPFAVKIDLPATVAEMAFLL